MKKILQKSRLTKNKIIKAIEESGGSKVLIAERCGVSRQTIYRWFVKHPDLNDYVKADQQLIAEIALSKKIEAVKNGNQKVCSEVLERWGKHLGWSKQEDKGEVLHPIQIIHEHVWTKETEPYSDGTKNLQPS